jgi:hypothetical protein
MATPARLQSRRQSLPPAVVLHCRPPGRSKHATESPKRATLALCGCPRGSDRRLDLSRLRAAGLGPAWAHNPRGGLCFIGHARLHAWFGACEGSSSAGQAGTTAIGPISTRKSGWARPLTTAAVMSGGLGRSPQHSLERRVAGSEVLAIDDEDVPLHDVLRPGTGGRQGREQVAQDLLGVCGDVADADDAPVGVAGRHVSFEL